VNEWCTDVLAEFVLLQKIHPRTDSFKFIVLCKTGGIKMMPQKQQIH
jgi:hypothetical protein